jgi:hypothetical protein
MIQKNTIRLKTFFIINLFEGINANTISYKLDQTLATLMGTNCIFLLTEKVPCVDDLYVDRLMIKYIAHNIFFN